MAKHITKIQNFCKGQERKISKGEVERIAAMGDGILIAKESR